MSFMRLLYRSVLEAVQRAVDEGDRTEPVTVGQRKAKAEQFFFHGRGE